MDAGLTISETAKRAGVSRDTISNAERGRHSLQGPTLSKIAHTLGRAPSELLAEEERLSPRAARRAPSEPTLLDGLKEERRETLEILFDNLRIHITGTADRWIRAAETSLLFWSEDAAIAFSVEVNSQAAHLYGFVSEALEPALETLFAGTLTLRSEQRKLIQAVEHLNKAVEMANNAADTVAPPREPTEEDWAAFAEIAEKLWEETDEVEQRRLLRKVAEVLAEESERAAEKWRSRIA